MTEKENSPMEQDESTTKQEEMPSVELPEAGDSEPPKPRYFAAFDEDGNISGFFVDRIHGDNIPDTAREIEEEKWRTYAAAPRLYKRDGDAIREKTPEEIDAERAARPKPPKSRVELLEEESALLTLELARTQFRLEQAEREQAALLLELVSREVI